MFWACVEISSFFFFFYASEMTFMSALLERSDRYGFKS